VTASDEMMIASNKVMAEDYEIAMITKRFHAISQRQHSSMVHPIAQLKLPMPHAEIHYTSCYLTCAYSLVSHVYLDPP
jgi:hypothetical protein